MPLSGWPLMTQAQSSPQRHLGPHRPRVWITPEDQVSRHTPVDPSTRLARIGLGSRPTPADPITRPTPMYSGSRCTPVDQGIRLAPVDPGIRPTYTLIQGTKPAPSGTLATSWPMNLWTGWLVKSFPCQSQSVKTQNGDYFKFTDINTRQQGS